MHIGAQPVPPSLIKHWKEYFPNHQYDTNYGLSESTGPGCVHLGVENIDKVGAIGVPGYRWECRIVDEDGNPVRQGEVGELCVKGPGLMTCYYNDPEATAQTLRDGWLFTGDMAMQDEDGFYFLVDRKKDVIVSGGENIYPVQIENFLSAYDKVKDVAVIGLPDKRLGEITGAIISVKDGTVAAAVLSAPCRPDRGFYLHAGHGRVYQRDRCDDHPHAGAKASGRHSGDRGASGAAPSSGGNTGTYQRAFRSSRRLFPRGFASREEMDPEVSHGGGGHGGRCDPDGSVSCAGVWRFTA